jgi:hypothetical protein
MNRATLQRSDRTGARDGIVFARALGRRVRRRVDRQLADALQFRDWRLPRLRDGGWFYVLLRIELLYAYTGLLRFGLGLPPRPSSYDL